MINQEKVLKYVMTLKGVLQKYLAIRDWEDYTLWISITIHYPLMKRTENSQTQRIIFTNEYIIIQLFILVWYDS